MAGSPIRIDHHAHVMRTDWPLVAGHRHAPDRNVSVQDFLSVLDANGMSHGVLTAPSFYGTDNGLLQEALAAAPDRLRGTAIVAPDTSADTLTSMRAAGFVGIRLNWLQRETLPDVDDYAALFRSARDLDWHVHIYLEGPKLAHVLPKLRAHGTKLVVDHFGSPDPKAGLACAGFQEVLRSFDTGRTWVKLAAPYRLGGADAAAYTQALLKAGGPERLLWASDFPWTQNDAGMTYGRCLDWLAEWVPDPAARAAILANGLGDILLFTEPADTGAHAG